MTKAYLTIDDIPSANLPAILNFLKEENIEPVMFTSGVFDEKYHDNLIQAIKMGSGH